MEAQTERIATRITRLTQIIQGRLAGGNAKYLLLSQDALLDALLALFEECSQPAYAKNNYAAEFIKKYQSLVTEVRTLRLNIRDFELKKLIGRGHYGEVQVVQEKKSGHIYALKIMRKSDVLSQQNVISCQDERDIMAKSTSPWITQLHYSFQDRRYLYLVMEFLPGGDLLALLAQYDESFSEDMARFYLAELVLAVHAVHTMDFVHRDVKPENVLIDQLGHIKLADFGSACRINDKMASIASIPAGTPDYVSPEVLSKMNDCRGAANGQFGPECDWWSVGVCAYEMLYGRTPFSDDSLAKTYNNIVNHKKRLTFPEDAEISKAAIELISGLLTVAEARLNYEAICGHAFFSDINFENIRQTRPPFIPQLKSYDDTSYFNDVEKNKPPPHIDEFQSQQNGLFNARDVTFVGFTFTRSIDLERQGSIRNEGDLSSSLLEKYQKSTKENELLEQCRLLEEKCSALQRSEETTKRKLVEATKRAEQENLERCAVEKCLVQSLSEVKSMKCQLDKDRIDHETAQLKAGEILEEMQQQALMAQKLQEEQHRLDVEECQSYIKRLEAEKASLCAKLSSMEKEIKKLNARDIPDSGIIEKHSRTIDSLSSQLEKERVERQGEIKRIKELEAKLIAQAKQFQQQMEERQKSEQQEFHLKIVQYEKEKADLVRSMEDLRVEISNRRRAAANMASMCEMDKESLKKEILRLEREVEMTKKAEFEFDVSFNERFIRLQKDYEERLRRSNLEHAKEEHRLNHMVVKSEEKVKLLEAQLETLKISHLHDEEQSIRVFEENEERESIISEQNLRISCLQKNVSALEDKIESLSKELERQKDFEKGLQKSTSTPLYFRMDLDNTQLTSACDDVSLTQYSIEDSNVFNDGGSDVTLGHRASPLQGKKTMRIVSQLEYIPRQVICISTSSQTDDDRYFVNVLGPEQSDAAPVLEDHETPESAAVADKFISQHVYNSPRFKSRKGRRVISDTVKVESSVPNKVSVSMQFQLKRWSMGSSNSNDQSLNGDKDCKENEEEKVNTNGNNIEIKETIDNGYAATVSDGLKDDNICRSKDVACETDTEQYKVIVNNVETQTMPIKEFDNYKRAHEDIVSSLMQEKVFLEARVEPLLSQIKDLKESVHTQRIRALDLKHELNEKTGQQDKLIEELKSKLSAAEASVSEMKESLKEVETKELAEREQLLKTTEKLENLKTQSSNTIIALQEEKDSLERQLKLLQNKITALETEQEELMKQTQESTTRLKNISEENARLKPRSWELEQEVTRLQAEKTKLKMQTDTMQSDMNEKIRLYETLMREKNQLKELCIEQEKQLEALEGLLKDKESKEITWTKERTVYEKAVTERESETDQIQNQLYCEQMKRMKIEEKERELSRQFTLLQETHTSFVERLNKQISEQKMKIESLSGQLKDLDCSHSMLQVDYKGLERRLESVTAENNSLKEEMSKLITKVSEYRSSNAALSKDLQAALSQCEELSVQKNKLENYLETLQVNYHHDQFKLESTIGQQTKLIDFLQTKVENPPKKKRGLFGGGSHHRQEVVPSAVHVRELQNSLDHEKHKTLTLRRQVAQMEEKLQQQPANEGTVHSSVSSAPNTPRPDTSVAVSGRPTSQRLQHSVPHRFITGINSRAVKCALCLGTVSFVKQAAKCQECSIVCHPKCAPSLPATCGMPTQYVQHLMETIGRARSVSVAKGSVAGLNIQMSGWMKIPRPGKQIWEKRWIVIDNNVLSIYTDEEETNSLDEFELRPSNRLVMVHGGVTAAELTNTAASDLPYIIKLEFEPETTCWPGRVIYLMALTFPEKQKWAATLEAIVNDGYNDEQLAVEQKVIRGVLLSLTSEKRMDFNCALSLAEKVVLVGTDQCLFVLDLCRIAHPGPLRRVSGLENVQSLSAVPGTDQVLAIAGHGRDLVMFSSSGLLEDLSLPPSQQRPLVVHARKLEGASTCTVFALGCLDNSTSSLYLCVATVEKVLLMIFSSEDGFVPIKEMLTSQACSCMLFTKKKIIFGTDKFYAIDPTDYTVTEFIDRRDSSLAFAAFGAICYDSFPTAVVKVSNNNEPEEFLLCFNEFGVFVNNLGRRSRQGDLKWHGLPLAFAFQAPYLYIVHFCAVEVLEIMSNDTDLLDGAKYFVKLSSPRLLGCGPAATVYISHAYSNTSEIITLKGNTKLLHLDDCDKENVSNQPLSNKQRAALKAPSDESQSALLRKMSRSPGRRLRESTTNSDIYDESP